jgi:Zn-finger nucleic acid-binding protein
VSLYETDIAGRKVGECPQCGGLWMDLPTFDRVCSDAAAQTAASGLTLPQKPPSDIHVHYLGCPKCGNLMGRLQYAGCSHVITNICRPHGIWLDNGQMQQIVEFIRSGGLDEARRHEINRLEDARRALESEQTIRRLSDQSPTY